MPRIFYSRHYNIGFYGLERFHPFDSRKYGKAWKRIRKHFGPSSATMRVRPQSPISENQLNRVHSQTYLSQLRDAKYLAGALELPALAKLPAWIIDRHVLDPMRWGTQGTVLAACEALRHGLAINLSGGYHHAKPSRGEGFCIYSDIGVAVAELRQQQLIRADDRVVYVDTDAHQGNGVCHTFLEDSQTFIFDIFHTNIYPCLDVRARERIDCPIKVTDKISDWEYMRELQNRLPGFLDSVNQSAIGLAIYNAGTDIIAGDPLGGLNIKPSTVLERDLYVVGELRRRGIPTVMLPSGGYTAHSYRLIVDSVIELILAEKTGVHD